MKAVYLITIATATLWTCVLCAPTTPKVPSPGAAHKHMPKLVAAYDDLRRKFEALKVVMKEIKALGYSGDLPAPLAPVTGGPAKDNGGDSFADFIHMPGAGGTAGTAAPGKSIDDAPVERKMTPSERMKLLSQKFHATHSGRGSMLSAAEGAKSGASGSLPPNDGTIPKAVANLPMDKLKSALAHIKTELKETILSETPVDNPNTKTKDKIDIAEKMRAKLKVQDRLQKFREQMKKEHPIHRVGEILQPVLLNRQGYNRIKRSAPGEKPNIRKSRATSGLNLYRPCRDPKRQKC